MHGIFEVASMSTQRGHVFKIETQKKHSKNIVMITNTHSGLFNPNGCLTSQAIRGYLDGSLRISAKHEVEKHLRHCRICSEALDGFMRHHSRDFLRSDLEFLSAKVRKRYSSTRIGNRRLPIMIAFSLVISLIILLIILYIIRQFLLNQ